MVRKAATAPTITGSLSSTKSTFGALETRPGLCNFFLSQASYQFRHSRFALLSNRHQALQLCHCLGQIKLHQPIAIAKLIPMH
jgi:hypothetical protein